MAICIDCIHGDVCRNAYTLKVEPPNVCGCFKNKTDVVEVVRCKDCKYNTELDGYEKRTYIEGCVACKYIQPNGERLVMCADDFCSYGERK